MKIIVLGANGMLGRYVFKYLSSIFTEVIPITSNEMDFLHLNTIPKLAAVFLPYNLNEGDVIINCVGLIPQRLSTREYTDGDFITLNSLLPHNLNTFTKNYNYELIHISTDCVFSGKEGNYSEIHTPDATDIYGKSKALGEPKDCTVIRTSIVGEELHNKVSLLEWVKSNKNKTVSGYKNHIWSGITCLKLAEIIGSIISNGEYWEGIRHLFIEHVTKYELVSIINEVYDLNIKIEPVDANEAHDKSLCSIYNMLYYIPDIKTQLEDLKNFTL